MNKTSDFSELSTKYYAIIAIQFKSGIARRKIYTVNFRGTVIGFPASNEKLNFWLEYIVWIFFFIVLLNFID